MSEHLPAKWPTYLDDGSLLSALNGIEDTQNMGVVLIDQGYVRNLRETAPGESTIVYERRRQGASDVNNTTPTRDAASSAPVEWLSFGFNCGGSVLAWVGVVGTSALVPVTGGLSGIGTGLLWGGALAASGACVASVYRVANVYRDRTDLNEALDKNQIYIWSMRGADGIGILGAGGAIKEFVRTGEILGESSLTWSRAANDALSRPMRKRLTEELELHGSKRVSAASIHSVVKQRMLDALTGAIGMIASATSGVLHEVIVWVVSPDESKR